MIYIVAFLMFFAGLGEYRWQTGAGLSLVVVSAVLLYIYLATDREFVAVSGLTVLIIAVGGAVAYHFGRFIKRFVIGR